MEKLDTRIVYSFSCTWWDDVYKVGKHPVNELPCCPYCGSMLLEMPSIESWWEQVDKYEREKEPGYRALVTWMRGQCFPSYTVAEAAFQQGQQVH